MLLVYHANAQSPSIDSLLKQIYFDFDQYEITNESAAILRQIVNSERRITHVFIEANTDFRGTVKYNQALGANRANAVKNYFLNKHIGQELITILNYGETKPLFKNNTVLKD